MWDCVYASRFWHSLMGQCNILFNESSDILSFWTLMNNAPTQSLRNQWSVAWATRAWVLWRERNKRLFANKQKVLHRMIVDTALEIAKNGERSFRDYQEGVPSRERFRGRIKHPCIARGDILVPSELVNIWLSVNYFFYQYKRWCAVAINHKKIIVCKVRKNISLVIILELFLSNSTSTLVELKKKSTLVYLIKLYFYLIYSL